MAAAVWFDPSALPPGLLGGLDDSKRLPVRERARIYEALQGTVRFALAAGSAARIDRDNIRSATLHAMRCAVLRLALDGPVLVDGLDVPAGLLPRARAVVRGESTVPQIAAASIVAKVVRDRLMARLAARHPAYGWERNAGYGTAFHLAALRRDGPTPHHRRSFAPVMRG